MYPKDLDIPIPDINVLNERINSPEYQVQARIIIAWNANVSMVFYYTIC